MRRALAVVISCVMALVLPASTYALSAAQLDFFAQNNILFYDPNGSGNCLMAGAIGGVVESDGSDVYMIGEESILDNELQNAIRQKFPKIQLNVTNNLSGVWTEQTLNDAEKRGILVISFGIGAGDFDIQQYLIEGLSGRDIKVILVTSYGADMLNKKIKELAENNENISLVDFAGNIGTSNKGKYIADNQLTTMGYDLYVKLLSDVVNGLTNMSGDVGSVRGLAQVNIDFIEKYHEIAASLSIQYGIPWETVMAQGILESDSGASTFAVERNNFFGIAAYDSNPNAARKYETPELGWKGYYDNIAITPVYRNNGVFQGATVTDPYEYLVAIKQAGYATSETYVQDLSPIVKSIEEYSKKKGWASSAQLAAAHSEWYENAAKNAQGVTVSSTGGYSGYFCDLESPNGTYLPTVEGESDRPIIGVSVNSASQVACDSRTTDIGVYDGHYRKSDGTVVTVKVRLCKLDKPGYQIYGNDGGLKGGSRVVGSYVPVNSLVSGAFAALAHRYYEQDEYGKTGNVLNGTSGYRTQAYQTYLSENNSGAAAVGKSKHELGLAVDITTGCELGITPGLCGNPMDIWLGKAVGNYGTTPGGFGLTRPVKNEAWHVQMSVTQIIYD